MKSNKKFLILLLIFLVLAIVGDDGTSFVLARKGIGSEWNPLVNWSIEKFGLEAMLTIKIVITILVAFAIIVCYRLGDEIGDTSGSMIILIYTIILYSWVTLHNISVMVDKDYLMPPLVLYVALALFGVVVIYKYKDKIKF